MRAQRRKKLLELGLCPNHKTQKVLPGFKQCQLCVDYQKDRAEERKIWSKSRRKELAELGFCQNHPAVPVVQNKRFCQKCVDKWEAAPTRQRTDNGKKLLDSRNESLSTKGLCLSHKDQPIVLGKTMCQKCIDNKKDYHQNLKKAGLCLKHPSVTALPGKTMCQECVDYNAKYSVKRRKNCADKGVCTHHGNRVDEGSKKCLECKAYANEYQNRKYSEDLQYKISKLLRNRISSAIKNGQKSGSAIKDLGCTIDEIIAFLESKFQPGMTWENWSHEGWHIDHIVPLAVFDLSNREQFLQAAHYTNLQPLWANENFAKHDKF